MSFSTLRQEMASVTPMDNNTKDTQTWPELAVGLYDKLTGRGAEIIYEFENMQIDVPSSASNEAQHATWKVNGIVKIRTKDAAMAAKA